MHNYLAIAGKVCCYISPSGEISGRRLFFLRAENRNAGAILSFMIYLGLNCVEDESRLGVRYGPPYGLTQQLVSNKGKLRYMSQSRCSLLELLQVLKFKELKLKIDVHIIIYTLNFGVQHQCCVFHR